MADNVYLFIPNVIGYGRIVLALVSFYYMQSNYVLASWCYIFSYLLDEVDGPVARMLNQATEFGAMLDMLTDRAAGMCLLVVLSHFYPTYMFCFQLSITIEVVSHWFHLHSIALKRGVSHKEIDKSANFLLRYYYTNAAFLSFTCAGNELFYVMLYILNFTTGHIVEFGRLSVGVFQLLCIICAPVAALKSTISCIQLYTAVHSIVALDKQDRKNKLVDFC